MRTRTLVQFRTANSLCRRCHKPLEVEEPERLVPQFAGEPEEAVAEDNGLQVARAVRDLRKGRNLSQRQLAGRMQVPRTYTPKSKTARRCPPCLPWHGLPLRWRSIFVTCYGTRVAASMKRQHRSSAIPFWPSLRPTFRRWIRCSARCSSIRCATWRWAAVEAHRPPDSHLP